MARTTQEIPVSPEEQYRALCLRIHRLCCRCRELCPHKEAERDRLIIEMRRVARRWRKSRPARLAIDREIGHALDDGPWQERLQLDKAEADMVLGWMDDVATQYEVNPFPLRDKDTVLAVFAVHPDLWLRWAYYELSLCESGKCLAWLDQKGRTP